MSAFIRAVVVAAGGLSGLAQGVYAQSLLDRPPNLSGDWVGRPGVVYFHFLHRFTESGPPERKVSNTPTFLVAAGLPGRTMVGVHYATNSRLAPRFPNEWEFFVRGSGLSQEHGDPLDLAGQAGYNLAARSVDGEVSLARRIGPLRLFAVGRALGDPIRENFIQFAVGGGSSLHLGRYVALTGDYARLFRRDEARGETPAWSAGIHLAIPHTPHTLSFHAANTNNATLQGASRGGAERRYGFEFTVPITLARYFSRRRPPAARPARPETTRRPDAVAKPATVTQAGMRAFSFTASRLNFMAGSAVIC